MPNTTRQPTDRGLQVGQLLAVMTPGVRYRVSEPAARLGYSIAGVRAVIGFAMRSDEVREEGPQGKRYFWRPMPWERGVKPPAQGIAEWGELQQYETTWRNSQSLAMLVRRPAPVKGAGRFSEMAD